MHSFTHEGTKISYYEYDEREDKTNGLPIVFVHGAGSSHIIWTIQAREFSRTHRVITLDLSGRPSSGTPKGCASVEHGYAHEVSALVQHLDLQDFVMVGHSMGGGVVMSYVLNPQFKKPRAIVLVNTSSNLDIRKLAIGLAIEFLEEKLLKIKSRILGDATEELRIIDEEQRLKDENPEMLSRDMDACDEFNITERLGDIDVPTLIIHGADDDIIRKGRARKLQEAIPDARLALVPDSDHNPMIEQPQMFYVHLKEFLDWIEGKT